jgi:hypothetical protein
LPASATSWIGGTSSFETRRTGAGLCLPGRAQFIEFLNRRSL